MSPSVLEFVFHPRCFHQALAKCDLAMHVDSSRLIAQDKGKDKDKKRLPPAIMLEAMGALLDAETCLENE